MVPQSQLPDDGGHGLDRIPLEPPSSAANTLQDLRQGHWQAYLALRDRLQSTRDTLESRHLQQAMLELKVRQQREELEWLRADALARNDLEDAARLEQGLAALETLETHHTPSTGGPIVNKLMLLLLLCLGCALGRPLRAAESVGADLESLNRLDEATPHPGPGAVADQPTPRAEPIALGELRSRHALALAALESAIMAATPSERAGLERTVGPLKQAQRRKELEWLRSDAQARGDAVYARRLDSALRNLTTQPRIVALVVAPRDPATGLPGNGAPEGGAR